MARELGVATRPRRSADPTVIMLVGLAATYVLLPEGDAANIFNVAAIGIGLSLAIATAVDVLAGGARSLVRVDILMLWILYGLTFLEFLVPREKLVESLSTDAAVSATGAAMLGFAGLVIGRHLIPQRSTGNRLKYHVHPRYIFLLFCLAAFLGYLHMLLAVRFDLLQMLREMAMPRFSQSWSRGRYGGDLFSLLVEVGALIYLIPPIAGLMYARRSEFKGWQIFIVTNILILTIYYGFSTGTRNILAVYIFTFFGAFILNRKDMTIWKVGIIGSAVLVAFLIAQTLMLEFRNVGLENFSIEQQKSEKLFIDDNMTIIARITQVFPDKHGYLGLEIPFNALIHPIPRAIWPGKPDGLSVTIESIAGTDQATISSTFVGEAYMSGGILGVVLAGIFFGMAAQMWNRVGFDADEPFAQLLYASGFLSAAITMRSMLWITVTMLPTLALWLFGKLVMTYPSGGARWKDMASGRRSPIDRSQ